MRVALFSDIHGNIVALEAVLADLKRHGPFDRIVVAGDLVWSGPRPAEVVERIQALDALVLQGNTDAFFGRNAQDTPDGKNSDRFVAQLGWMRDQLGDVRAQYLAQLPFSQRLSPAPGQDLWIVHANPFDQDRPLMKQMPEGELDRLLAPTPNDWAALAFGHVHVPYVRPWRDRLLVDVASAGLPMDNDPRPAYAVLTWDGCWHAEHHRVFYDAPLVARDMRTCGLPRGAHFAERLMAAHYGAQPLPAFAF